MIEAGSGAAMIFLGPDIAPFVPELETGGMKLSTKSQKLHSTTFASTQLRQSCSKLNHNSTLYPG
jgi:hypothetical protein